MTIAERRAERHVIREAAIVFKRENPQATKTQIKAAMKARWESQGLDPVKLKRWMEILMELLPLILKLFA